MGAKLVARPLATASHRARIQTSLKNHKWATYTKEWSTHSSPPKNKYKENAVSHLLSGVYVMHKKFPSIKLYQQDCNAFLPISNILYM